MELLHESSDDMDSLILHRTKERYRIGKQKNSIAGLNMTLVPPEAHRMHSAAPRAIHIKKGLPHHRFLTRMTLLAEQRRVRG
jgi:hypothetical protein